MSRKLELGARCSERGHRHLTARANPAPQLHLLKMYQQFHLPLQTSAGSAGVFEWLTGGRAEQLRNSVTSDSFSDRKTKSVPQYANTAVNMRSSCYSNHLIDIFIFPSICSRQARVDPCPRGGVSIRLCLPALSLPHSVSVPR